MDVRLTDRDVILVRRGIAYTAGPRLVYQNHLPLVVGGKVPVKLVRGYHSVAIAHEGTAFTFVNSHLEVGGPAEPAQEGQARELVAALGAIPGALIVAGDFNSPADKTGTDSYEQLTRTLTDGWNRTVGDLKPGFTCCTALSAASFDADSRIDLVLVRGSVRPETRHRHRHGRRPAYGGRAVRVGPRRGGDELVAAHGAVAMPAPAMSTVASPPR